MAVTGTQLYNQDKKKIYPISDAGIINCEASGEPSTVHADIVNLYKLIDQLTGDNEQVSNITITVTYKRSKSSDANDVKGDTGWSSVFSIPNSEYPYTWKRTVIKTHTVTNTTYEIIAADVSEKIQTIYIAKSKREQPVITYPQVQDNQGNKYDDLTAFDYAPPKGWSETPVSISAATPYVYMSVRKRVDGLWEKYSEPALFGNWAYDSVLEMRYQVSDTKPEVLATEDIPGTGWLEEAPEEFTGKLWMITATSVNGIINVGDDGIKWRGPTLMAVVS